MPVVTFFVPGEVKGLARPRASTVGGHARLYDPSQNRSEKASIQQYLLAEWKGGIALPNTRGFHVEIHASFAPPKSMTKMQQRMAMTGNVLPRKKPDVDNIAKLVLDSLNKVIWVDDSEVTELSVFKFYSDRPGLKVTISWEY